MKGVERIFLDLDGPLLDGKERHYRCYQSILESFGLKPVGFDDYWESKRALVSRKELLLASGAQSIYEEYLVAWLNLIETPAMLALDKVQDGAIECLRAWKSQGAELLLVTMRKDKVALERQLESTGLRQFLDAVLVCDHEEGGEGKAHAVCNYFETEFITDKSLWIGDTEADWVAAKTLGCPVVLLSNGLRNDTYLRSLESAIVMPSIASLRNTFLKEANAHR